MKCIFPLPRGTCPASNVAFLIGLGLFGARSLGTTSIIDVKRTPTRPMTKTDPISPKIANPRESSRISDDLRRVLKLGGILGQISQVVLGNACRPLESS